MKKVIIIMMIFAGAATFAQPTLGDIEMAEVVEEMDTIERIALTPQQAQQLFESTLVSAFKTGKTDKLAVYFGENVDLSILTKANLYSKSQAQQVLQHFFDSNKPTDFKIIHKSDSKTNQYFIGELKGENGKNFRVTLNSKMVNNKRNISSLTIEKSEG